VIQLKKIERQTKKERKLNHKNAWPVQSTTTTCHRLIMKLLQWYIAKVKVICNHSSMMRYQSRQHKFQQKQVHMAK